MTEEKKSILCIEDNEDTCELISFVFGQTDYPVTTCSQTDCLTRIHEETFLAIILDNYFHGVTGIEICREIRSFDQKTPIVFLSGEAREDEINKALAAGANDYLVKPNDFEKLTETVIKLIDETGKRADA